MSGADKVAATLEQHFTQVWEALLKSEPGLGPDKNLLLRHIYMVGANTALYLAVNVELDDSGEPIIMLRPSTILRLIEEVNAVRASVEAPVGHG